MVALENVVYDDNIGCIIAALDSDHALRIASSNFPKYFGVRSCVVKFQHKGKIVTLFSYLDEI